MIIVPRDVWGIWLYIVCASVMAGNATVLMMIWWNVRLAIFAVAALMFGALCLAFTMMTAILALTPPHGQIWIWFLYGQRFGFLLATVSSLILIDIGVADHRQSVSGVYRLIRWWARFPKVKAIVYLLLLATLYMVTSCAPVQGGRWFYRDYQPICVRWVDPCDGWDITRGHV